MLKRRLKKISVGNLAFWGQCDPGNWYVETEELHQGQNYCDRDRQQSRERWQKRGHIDAAQQNAFKSPPPHLNSNLQLERLGKVAPLGK